MDWALRSMLTTGVCVCVSHVLWQTLCPKDYSHLVCSFEPCGDISGGFKTAVQRFKSVLRMNLTTKEEVMQWLKDFQASSGITWKTARTFPNIGKPVKFKVRDCFIHVIQNAFILFTVNWCDNYIYMAFTLNIIHLMYFCNVKLHLRCQHQTRWTNPHKKRTKNTSCPATMYMVLRMPYTPEYIKRG